MKRRVIMFLNILTETKSLPSPLPSTFLSPPSWALWQHWGPFLQNCLTGGIQANISSRKMESFFFILKIFIYLFERESKWKSTSRGSSRGQRQKQTPCWAGTPNVGLDPRTPGSWPEQKADFQPTEPPRCPLKHFSKENPSPAHGYFYLGTLSS